jgi:hypothetical protein
MIDYPRPFPYQTTTCPIGSYFYGGMVMVFIDGSHRAEYDSSYDEVIKFGLSIRPLGGILIPDKG